MVDLEDLQPNQEEGPDEVSDDSSGLEDSSDAVGDSGPEESEATSSEELESESRKAHGFTAEQLFMEDEDEPPDESLGELEREPELDRDALEQLYDESMKDLKEGNIVTGRIIEVDDTSVLIDIGYKSEGILPRSELEDALFPVQAQVGQEIEVVLEAIENQDGRVMLSKRRADRLRFWDDLKASFQNNEPVEGTIVSRKRGGYTVDLKGIKAFLPGSQLDLHPVRDMDEFVGKTFPMKILNLEVQGTHRNIVLSRRAVLEADLQDRIESTLSKLQEGRTVKGIVKNITDWGVFIDLGGIDGLLHRTDISWGRTEHPSQYFNVGDEVEVIILRFDRERNQVSLGYKQKTPDPWQHVEERYYEGKRVKGHVVSLKQYGAFVELEESIQGLLHVSEMSWTKRIEHPSQVINEEDVIDVVVLRVDAAERKISLGLKQLTEDPWLRIAEMYPDGSRVTGIAREISHIGAKVEIDEDIVGFLHRSNITWSRHMRHPGDMLELGDTLDLVVLGSDPKAHKLSLGLKQIKVDPWEGIEQELKPDMIITGKVINILDFGAFVEVRPGVEGLVHISEIANKRIGHPAQVLDQNQEVQVKILSVSQQDHRLSLSVRECLDEEQEQRMMEKLRKAQEREAARLEAKRERDAKKSQDEKLTSPSDEIAKDGTTPSKLPEAELSQTEPESPLQETAPQDVQKPEESTAEELTEETRPAPEPGEPTEEAAQAEEVDAETAQPTEEQPEDMTALEPPEQEAAQERAQEVEPVPTEDVSPPEPRELDTSEEAQQEPGAEEQERLETVEPPMPEEQPLEVGEGDEESPAPSEEIDEQVEEPDAAESLAVDETMKETAPEETEDEAVVQATPDDSEVLPGPDPGDEAQKKE